MGLNANVKLKNYTDTVLSVINTKYDSQDSPGKPL